MPVNHAGTSNKPPQRSVAKELAAESRTREEEVRHFATAALMGLVNRSPLLGRYDAMCTRAWEIGDAMVCAHEGVASVRQVKHDAKVAGEALAKERADLARVMERQKLLTKALEEKLAPPAKVAQAVTTE